MEKRKGKLLLGMLAAAAATWALWHYAGTPMIRFLSDPEMLHSWVQTYGILTRLLYMGMQIFQIVIAVIPGEPFEIAAGFAFGAVEGTALCMLSAALGSVLVFELVRKFGRRFVLLFFKEEQLEKLRFLSSDPKRQMLFLIIYMIPGTPKDLLSYFAGLTDMKLPAWLLICSLGRFPSIVTSTLGGHALRNQNYGFAAAVFLVTFAIAAWGLFVYNKICKEKA